MNTRTEQLLTEIRDILKRPAPSPKLIYGIGGLAKYLNVCYTKAHKMKKSGQVPFIQNGRVVIFEEHEILNSLKKQTNGNKQL
jgi:hypothetical protein